MKRYYLESGAGFLLNESRHYTPSIAAKTAFFYLQSSGHFRCNEEYFTRREGYNSFLMLYTMEGRGRAEYRGRQVELQAGQILLIDCNDYQEYFTSRGEEWEFKWFHFNGSTSKEYFNLIYGRSGAVIQLGERLSVPGLMDELMELGGGNEPGMEAKASGLIVQILTELLLTNESKTGGRSGTADARIQPVLELIDREYSREIPLEEMAAMTYCSKYHFIRIFRKACGFSPREYLTKCRINKAKELLSGTNLTVEAIARSVGYESTSNFSRAFKELEEMTPLNYRGLWGGNR